MPGYVSENDNGITVVMDTNLSEELLEEGFVREIISKVQTMRKEAGFEVMDKIAVSYEGTEKAEKYLQTMHLRSQMKHLHWKLQKQYLQATRKSGRSMEKL